MLTRSGLPFQSATQGEKPDKKRGKDEQDQQHFVIQSTAISAVKRGIRVSLKLSRDGGLLGAEKL